jgi:enterochelin esterase-like enzyme
MHVVNRITMISTKVKISRHALRSAPLNRSVDLIVYTPGDMVAGERLNLLLMNDGQEAEGLKIEEALNSLYASMSIDPVVVVAIKASDDRLQEYGVAGIPDFGNRGSKANLYNDFIVKELLPYLEKKLKIQAGGKKAFAGFSLGGLSAFDISWRNDQLFDVVGAFSASFWWRKKDLNDGYTENDRIMHQVIRNTAHKPELKVWLMTGTEDETEDRNHNYIIDSIDDTIDVIKALMEKGYSRPDEVFYYEMVGGRHEVGYWAKALPSFICWAFPRTAVF